MRRQFVKVMPRDYKRMLDALERVKRAEGLSGDEAAMAAFELNKSDDCSRDVRVGN